MKEQKYRVESFQSGTMWLVSSTGLKLHCGYWTDQKLASRFCLGHRGKKERDAFVHVLKDGLNDMEKGKAEGYKPYVLLNTITYTGCPWALIFEDLFFGELELINYRTDSGTWKKEKIPSDFWKDLQALCERVKECAKMDR